jgi:hypothetical protein
MYITIVCEVLWCKSTTTQYFTEPIFEVCRTDEFNKINVNI